MAGSFEESKHPRDHGKFASGGGGSSGTAPRTRAGSAKAIVGAGKQRMSKAAQARSDKAKVDAMLGPKKKAASPPGGPRTPAGGSGGGDSPKFEKETHYVASIHPVSGEKHMREHEAPTQRAHVDHGSYMVRADGGKHMAVYFPKDKGAASGGKDVQFIDGHGRPNVGEMGQHGSDSEAKAAIAKHHATVKSGKRFGVYDPNSNTSF